MAAINLKRNIMVSGTFRIVNMVIMFLTSLLSTRYLGVELKGQYSYLTTLVAFGWMTLDIGISKTYPYLLRKDEACLPRLFTWTCILFVGELLLLGSLGAFFLPRVSSLLSYHFSFTGWWVFISLIIVSQLMNQLRMLYLGMDRILDNSMVELLYQLLVVLAVGLSFIFLKKADRLLVVLSVLLFSAVTVLVPYVGKIARNFNLKSLAPAFLWKSYKMGIRVFLSTMFITLLIRADIVILKRLMDFSSVGIYSLSAHIVDMLQIASNLVGSLLLVKLSDTEDEELRWVLMKRIFMLFFVFLSAANLGFALVGKPLIRLLYGAAFEGAYYSTLWLIPASFGLSFGSLFNTYLWSKGFPVVSTVVPFIVLLLNISLNFLLIPSMGIAGSALASSISYCLWFVIILIYEQYQSHGRLLKYLVPAREDWSEVWKMGLASLASIFRRGGR
jgi:O-antigen/teichoic acid export membrane protein